MANSRTLLVYVLAIVVCSGCSSSFWVSANTVPVLKEPVASTGASPSSPQYQQRYPQHHRFQQQQLTAQHQQIQETSRTSSSPVVAPAAPPQHQSTDKSNNAPAAISIKNAWGLSAGSSDSGPYMAGHSYISGRTFEQPINTPKSTYDLVDDRTSRQVGPSIFSGLQTSFQDWLFNGVSMKSILLGGLMTYGVQNFGIPESVNQLIPMVGYFRSAVKEAKNKEEEVKNKEKEAAVPVKEAPAKQVPVIGKDVPTKKGVMKEVKEVPMKVEVASEKEEKPAPEKEEKPAPEKEEKPAPEKEEKPAPEKEEKPAPEKEEKPAPEKEENSAPEKDVKPAPEPSKTEADAPKLRKKRDHTTQADTDLTELAALVLSAIQSGDCMQKSICLMGRQIGATNKGRAAFLLVDKLIPESVQGNQYFVTMKKALRSGESFCDTFRCRLN